MFFMNGSGKKRLGFVTTFLVSSRAVDPHSIYADPDPADFLNAGPGPA